MTVAIRSAALAGIDAVLIEVETRVCAGVSYFIVGLAGEAVKESLFRVESAISSAGFEMPRQKILISLAPAGIRKEGAVFDLPIALSILAASGQLDPELMNEVLFTGELSLRMKPPWSVPNITNIIRLFLKFTNFGRHLRPGLYAISAPRDAAA